MKCYRMPIIRYTHPHQPVKPLSTRLSPESATDIGDRALAIAQRHWIWLGASDAVANIVGASAQVATWPLRLATMFATTPESRFFDPWYFVASGVFANSTKKQICGRPSARKRHRQARKGMQNPPSEEVDSDEIGPG